MGDEQCFGRKSARSVGHRSGEAGAGEGSRSPYSPIPSRTLGMNNSSWWRSYGLLIMTSLPRRGVRRGSILPGADADIAGDLPTAVFLPVTELVGGDRSALPEEAFGHHLAGERGAVLLIDYLVELLAERIDARVALPRRQRDRDRFVRPGRRRLH